MGAQTKEFSGVPIIDLSAFTTAKERSDISIQRDVADELVKICEVWGCAGIKGHGLSPSTLAGLWKRSRDIFTMPLEDKMKAPHPTNSFVPHRGYTPVGGEKVFRRDEMAENGDNEDFWKTKKSITDYKESFDIGSVHNKTHGNNFYPESMFPGLQKFSLEAYEELHQVCMNILEAILVGLNLTEGEKQEVLAAHSGVNDHLRLMHYPSLPAEVVEGPESGRMQQHTDFGTLTLVFQDSCGGLEFADPGNEGTFVPATPLDGVVYLNIADILSQVPTHRVVIPSQRVQMESGETFTPERYSIPFFMQPDETGLVAVPESLVKADGVRKYEPIVFQDYTAFRAKLLFKKD